jgi:hypothetical protein
MYKRVEFPMLAVCFFFLHWRTHHLANPSQNDAPPPAKPKAASRPTSRDTTHQSIACQGSMIPVSTSESIPP